MKKELQQGLLLCLFASTLSCELHEAPQPNDERSCLTNIERVVEQPEAICMLISVPPAGPENGIKGFYEYVNKNLQYPEQTKNMGVQGKVFVQFVVEIDGSLSNFTVIKGIGHGCDEEAVRLLQNGPKWIPGTLQGKPVRQTMVFPIRF